jgi:hypothetical protein
MMSSWLRLTRVAGRKVKGLSQRRRQRQGAAGRLKECPTTISRFLQVQDVRLDAAHHACDQFSVGEDRQQFAVLRFNRLGKLNALSNDLLES